MPLARYKNLAAERKEAILRAAAHEFAEKGYERASLNRMISEAGLSKGTFYYYFEDKADLFVTVLREKLPSETWMAEIGLMETAGPEAFWKALKELEFRKYAYLGQYPEVARLAEAAQGLTASHFENASLAVYAEERVAEVRSIFDFGRSIDAVRSDLPMPLLLTLWTGLERSLSEWIFQDWEVLSQLERQQRGDVAVDTFRRVFQGAMSDDSLTTLPP